MPHPITPDGHYFVVRGRLWRCSNPALPEATRQRHVDALMAARRAVKAHAGDPVARAAARRQVDAAKRALGERGPVWWTEGGTYDRCLVVNTPYQAWYAGLSPEAGGPGRG